MSDFAVLRVEHITKAFGGQPILKGVSLELFPGNLKVLIGPSGGGKSTLLQCINHLIPPDSGQVYLEGERLNPASKQNLRSFRRQVGMIFQDFNLFEHLSALDNVRVALGLVRGFSKAQATERAMAELTRGGLQSRAGHYPAQLSGGQKQRVSVARALAMDPKVMLLDEPTSALDPELIGEVLAVIRDLATLGMPMIMATHQIGFAASLADEFLFMDHGVIVEHGSPADLLAKGSESRTRAFSAKISELTCEMGE